MRIVVAFDSFKGSLSSIEAGEAAKKGILKGITDAEVLVCPMADGGEGTVSAIAFALGGRICKVEVCGPLGEKVVAEYGVISEKQLAVIEMSAAAGITLVPDGKRNPLNTTTYGVGELIRHAIEKMGC